MVFTDPYNKYLELNHEGYEDYLRSVSTNIKDPSARYVFKFPNGYGACVMKCQGSYGYEFDQWELAVIQFNEKGTRWGVCYETPIGDSIFGWCTDEKVRKLLGLIKDLPECEGEYV